MDETIMTYLGRKIFGKENGVVAIVCPLGFLGGGTVQGGKSSTIGEGRKSLQGGEV